MNQSVVKRPIKSYGEQPAAPTNKWLAVATLTALLVLGLGSFLWMLWPRDEERVFLSGVNIAEFGERILPQPAFPNWQADMPEPDAWKPWVPLTGQQRTGSSQHSITAATSSQLPQIAQTIRRDFSDHNGTSKDTLIVYVRGQALQPNEGDTTDVLLLAPEYHPTSAPSARLSVKQLLEEIKKTRAANIVVLADIQDMLVAPKLGVLRNDVCSGLMKIVSDLPKQGTPLWLITAANSSQPAHVSYLLEKTLFQSAVDFSLSFNRPDQQNHLSLADFYEVMLRYCHKASDGYQTPLLLASGYGRYLDNPQSDQWRRAEKVIVAQYNKRWSTQQIKKVTPEPTEPPTVASQNRNSAAPRMVSISQLPSSPDVSQQTLSSVANSPAGAATATTAGQNQQNTPQPDSQSSGTEQPGTALPTETDAWLQFWQERDKVAQTKPGALPPPISFAAARWQFVLQEAIRIERLTRLGSSKTTNNRELNELHLELSECLNHAPSARSFSSTRRVNAATLSELWTQVQLDLDKPSDPRRPWLNPQLLAPDIQPIWEQERGALLEFMYSAEQLSQWMELYLQPDIDDLAVGLRTSTDALAREIQRTKRKLALREFLLDDAAQLSQISTTLRAALNNLRRSLDASYSKLSALLPGDQQTVPRSKLSWRDERKLQLWLSTSLLTYPQRKRLAEYYQLSADDLLDSLPERILLSRSKPWSELLKPARSDGLDAQVWLTTIDDLCVGEKPVDQWLHGCFSELRRILPDPSSSKVTTGDLLMPISSDQRIQLVGIPDTHQLPSTLNLAIRRRNGTSLDKCYLKWTAEPVGGQPDWWIVGSGGTRVEPDSPVLVDIRNDYIDLDIRVAGGPQKLTSAVRARLRLSEDNADAADYLEHWLTIVPPISERVELFVKRWDGSQRKLEETVARASFDEQGHGWLNNSITVPAIGQATAQYQFYLSNRSNESKQFRVRLYPATDDKLSLGDGHVVPDSTSGVIAGLDKLTALAEVPSITLPASTPKDFDSVHKIPKNAQQLDLAQPSPPPGAPEVLKKSKENLTGGLLLELAELVEAQAVPSQPGPQGTENASKWTLGQQRHYFWIDCTYQNPSGWINGLASQPFIRLDVVPNDESVSLQAQVDRSFWAYWDVEDLKIVGTFTDQDGNPLQNRRAGSVDADSPDAGSQVVMLLNPQKPSDKRPFELSTAGLTGRPEKVVLHVDIGNYPRAVAYQWEHEVFDITSSNQSFLWIDESRMSLTTETEQDTNLVLPKFSNEEGPAYILPRRKGVTHNSRGTEVKPLMLSIPFRVDLPRSNSDSSFTASLSNDGLSSRTYDCDRRFNPSLQFFEGRLAVSASADDHVFDVKPAELGSKSGVRKFQVSVGDKSRTLTLIVDNEPPRESATVRIRESARGVLRERADLYVGESVEIALRAEDVLSPINHVYFAINRRLDNQVKIQYDEDDFDLIESILRDDGIWSASISAEEFEVKRRPNLGQEYHVVARSVDAAGNIQDQHQHATLVWMGKRPVKPPKQVEPPAPPPPEPPKTFTITVVVLAEGQSPNYPDRIKVSGPGDRRAPSENRFHFDNVPAGNAEFKAVYTTPNNKIFEAQEAINVTRSQTIRLNATPKK
ncbi:MAG: hypothetical protein KF752_08195 [Pirellulaceae bacterium]|nr:hypothetical protein [Pirellulaceae bacterium]